MNESTQPQAIDINKVKNKLLQQKNDIHRLEQEVARLQKTLRDTEETDHRIKTEATLAEQDAELARSFNQKNYAPIVSALFEKPSRQLRNRAIIIVFLSVISALAAGYFSAGYLTYTHHAALNNKIDSLQEQLTTFIKQQKIQQEITQKQIDTYRQDVYKKTASKEITTRQTPATITAPAQAITLNDPRKNRITQQAEMIVQHVRNAEKQPGFIVDYRNDKTQFAQLYIIVMQHASNENIFYESYLEAIQQLGISPTIAPKNKAELLKMDVEFLQAAYSGFIITSKKRANGWRYRESDREFSSYYSGNIDYDLGSWKIINESGDYKNLPNIFALNIDRVSQQILFNGEKLSLLLPKTIYYLAYAEDSKNQAIENLLNQETIKKINSKLSIDATNFDIPISDKAKNILRETLSAKGVEIKNSSEDELKEAADRYRVQVGWKKNGVVNLRLLHHLNIFPSYRDLKSL